ncbi:MAG: polysaccharide pyruvyl transferase family protein [Bacteroidales bacterium]|nr:polysaccharide pyruvyl transferase family protein [Clostridium sp.]MCM1202931.1 polysaccharide pyruvyl transferase family protein [Bacteroidales bacterium]
MENQCNNIKCLEQNRCTGCGACYNKCPFDAITMQYDGDGFMFPVVDEEKCTSCGACKLACPALNPSYPNAKEPEVYAACASDDIRMKCSSGGLFTVFANKVLAEGGYVCGAAMSKDNLNAEFILTDSEEGLNRIKGSKYIQSKVGNAYRQIEEKLKEGKTVIFGGCPCNVAGLRQYLRKDYDNLYLIDVLCTGGISQLVWEKYLKEFHRGKPVFEVKFRDKEKIGWSHGMHIFFRDGSHYYGDKNIDLFYKVFMDKLAFRESCGECPFANTSRQGDITLGDFWGVRKLDAELDDGKGTSIVTINNERGRRLFEEIKDELIKLKEVPFEFLMERKQPFQAPKQPNAKRERFMKLLPTHTLKAAYEYALSGKYDIGIVGVWWGSNYGSMMTYYSLMKLLNSFGLSTIMIDKQGSRPDEPFLFTHARKFAESHFEAISPIYPYEYVYMLNSLCDGFIVGSDQVWNYGISGHWRKTFFLKYVEEHKKKISYAASFGHDFSTDPPKEIPVHQKLLRRFDAISVREQSGVDILRDVYGVRAQRVLDPVFMVDREVYDEVMKESDRKVDEPFIATYILDPTPEKREAMLYLAEKKGMKLINMLDGFRQKQEANKEKLQLDVDENVEVQDWLYYIGHCEYLITDSCHGASFAMIYEKPFVCIGNEARGLTRFESLFRLVKLEDRLVLDAKEIPERPDLLEPVDYAPVKEILKEEREAASEWLKKALFSERIEDSNWFYAYADTRLKEKPPENWEENVTINRNYRASDEEKSHERRSIFWKEHIKPHISQKVNDGIKKIVEH